MRFWCALILICSQACASQLPGPQNAPSVSPPNSVAVATIPWERWFKADAITPVADATAVSSWVNSDTSTDPATASGAARPVYKIPANGINGVPVLRFAGAQYMQTVHGGAALTSSSFYMFVVARPNTINAFQHYLCFGDDAETHRRGMLIWGNSTRGINTLSFNGAGSDVNPLSGAPTVASGTAYLFEIYWDGAFIHIFQNGVLTAMFPPLEAFGTSSTDVITIGANNSLGENITGDIAELGLLRAVPSGEQFSAVRSYCATKYALTMPTNVPAAGTSGTMLLARKFSDDGSRVVFDLPIVIGGDQPGTVNSTVNNYKSQLTLFGALYADAGAFGDHILRSNIASANVLCLENDSDAGFSVMRTKNSGHIEASAFGSSNVSTPTPWNVNSNGSTFIETNRTDGTFAFVQTGSGLNSGNPALRYAFLNNGTLNFYDGSAAVGPITAQLTTSGLLTRYNNLATAGTGIPYIVASGRATAQTALAASIATFTPAADGSFLIGANVNVTTSTAFTFTMTCTYTDEGNTARTQTIPFVQIAGTPLTSITNVTGAGPYEGIPVRIRAKAATAITIQTVGTFTTVTYNAEADITQVK